MIVRDRGVRRAGRKLARTGIGSVRRRRCDLRNIVFLVEEIEFLGGGVGYRHSRMCVGRGK